MTRRAIHLALLVFFVTAWDPIVSAASVTRGPYLQMGTPTSVVVRWRTDTATDSRVRFGPAPGSLTSSANNPAVTTEHEVTVSGLTPDTQYYYSVGTSTATLAGDATYFWVTFPPAGVPAPTRVWVLGDSGTANGNAMAVRNAYLNATGPRHTDLWLMLGDNAYNNGLDSEYQSAVFNLYPTMLRKSVLFPALGNHDTGQATQFVDTYPYFAIFTLPRNGECGGVASGTEHYYAVDFGNLHFICLDSMTADRSSGGPMAAWLQQDLASTTQEWVVAFWHHPPYTKGSHNSDTEVELIQMRQTFLPILEAGGVDLVLGGHSHDYERSFLIDGHYGSSTTFGSGNLVDGGSGRDPAPYRKAPNGASHEGAVYVVAGSSGQTSGGTLNHPAMFLSLNVLGSVVLDFTTNRLDLQFLDSAGVVRDTFAIVKGGAVTAPNPPTALVARASGKKKINLTWTQSNSPNLTQNKIYAATVNGGPYNLIATIPAATSFNNTGLTSGVTYYYVVTAVNSSGLESGASNQAFGTAR